MASGRELLAALLEGQKPSRPPFVPALASTAARVGGSSLEAMTADPALWSGHLLRAADLFDLDGLVVGFDPTLTAEACGCAVGWDADRPTLASTTKGLPEAPESAGRMSVALEAAARSFSVCRGRRACIAVVTGPITLASQLFGAEEGDARLGEAKTPVLRLAEAFCKLRPDLLLLLEGERLSRAELPPSWRRLYGTVRNVASYYSVPLGLWTDGFREGDAGRLLSLGVDLLALGRSAEGRFPTGAELGSLASSSVGVGVSLPLEDSDAACSAVGEWRRLTGDGRGPPLFYTGGESGGRALEPDSLHRIGREIRS